MKKLFILSLLAVCAFVGCTPDEPQLPAVLTLTSENHINIEAEGGEGVITYTLENVKEGVYPTVESGVEWITNINANETITFTIEANPEEVERVGNVVVSYKEQSFTVAVKQEAAIIPDLTYEAKALNGEYFGVSEISRAHNYFAILSTLGTTGLIDLYLDVYYRFDLFSDVAPVEGEPLRIPEGTYKLDHYGTQEPWTFSSGYSLRFETFEDGTYKETFFLTGELVVKEDSIEGIFVMDNNDVHRVVYSGDMELKYLEIEYKGPFSILTEDYIFGEQTADTLRLIYYGDDYGVGGGNWVVQTMEKNNPVSGDYFSLDIVTEKLGYELDNIVGTYDIVPVEEIGTGKCAAGTYDGSPNYSWYCICKDNYFESFTAPLVGGKITIEKDGNSYMVIIDCVDDNGYKIQGKIRSNSVEPYDRT